MSDSQIRPFKRQLFAINNLRLGNGLREEGKTGSYAPDIHQNHQVSEWLAVRFARENISIDKENDVVAEIDENEWRIVNWPLRNYVYQVKREHRTLYIDLAEQHHLRVLSLDAGGIAGYFNARLLQKIHKKLQEKVAELKRAFDDHKSHLKDSPDLQDLEDTINRIQTNFLDDVDHLMGTSAGSVNAAILAQADKPTSQLDRCIDVWREPRLFDNEPINRLLSIYGLKSLVSFTKYKKSLSKYIPDGMPLKDLKKGALFTTFALDPRDGSPRAKPKIFNSADPQDENELTLDVVLRSGSAAPIGALHQGYADGGWFSASPSTHVLPLFSSLKAYNSEENEKLREPLKKALNQYLIKPRVVGSLFPQQPFLTRENYATITESLNSQEIPKELHIRFFETETYDLEPDIDIGITKSSVETKKEEKRYTLTLGNKKFEIHIRTQTSLFTMRIWFTESKNWVRLIPIDSYPNEMSLTQDERDELVTELDKLVQRHEGKAQNQPRPILRLPSKLRKRYCPQSLVIDFATQPVQFGTVKPHYEWNVATIEDSGEPKLFRIEAKPDFGRIAVSQLKYGTDDGKLVDWFKQLYSNQLPDIFTERRIEYNKTKDEETRKNIIDKGLNALIDQTKPEAKLSLLSVGVGIKNKRLTMPKEDYHWGYLNLMFPSPWNQFFSLGAAMASAQADTATEQIDNLDRLNTELNFYRIDPAVLSINRFAYSILAINPALKDTAIAMLERDLGKPAVDVDIEKTVRWLFRYWILGDDEYRRLTALSSQFFMPLQL